MLVPTTHRIYLRGRLRTPHDVVVAIPVGRFKLLHRAILVRPHAGKVPADGPLPLARVYHSSGGTSAGPSIRAATIQPRSGGFRRRQRGHLAKQIAEIVHCGWAFLLLFLENMAIQRVFLQGTDNEFTRRFGLLSNTQKYLKISLSITHLSLLN